MLVVDIGVCDEGAMSSAGPVHGDRLVGRDAEAASAFHNVEGGVAVYTGLGCVAGENDFLLARGPRSLLVAPLIFT